MRDIVSPLAGFSSPFGQRRDFSPFTLFAGGEEGVWYDPSDLTTLFQDVAGTTPVTTPGQTVALMLDKSGNDYHATQSTAAARPTYQVDAGGRGYLSFDGVDDGMVTPTITPETSTSQIFAGVRKLSSSLFQCIVEHGTNVGSVPRTMALWVNWGSAGRYAHLQRGSSGARAYFSSPFAAPTTNITSSLFDLDGTTISENIIPRVDGALRADGIISNDATIGTGVFAPHPLYIGARTGSSFFFTGHIYSLITRFGPNLDAPVIGKTETYVAKKTGVDLT